MLAFTSPKASTHVCKYVVPYHTTDTIKLPSHLRNQYEAFVCPYHLDYAKYMIWFKKESQVLLSFLDIDRINFFGKIASNIVNFLTSYDQKQSIWFFKAKELAKSFHVAIVPKQTWFEKTHEVEYILYYRNIQSILLYNSTYDTYHIIVYNTSTLATLVYSNVVQARDYSKEDILVIGVLSIAKALNRWKHNLTDFHIDLHIQVPSTEGYLALLFLVSDNAHGSRMSIVLLADKRGIKDKSTITHFKVCIMPIDDNWPTISKKGEYVAFFNSEQDLLYFGVESGTGIIKVEGIVADMSRSITLKPTKPLYKKTTSDEEYKVRILRKINEHYTQLSLSVTEDHAKSSSYDLPDLIIDNHTGHFVSIDKIVKLVENGDTLWIDDGTQIYKIEKVNGVMEMKTYSTELCRITLTFLYELEFPFYVLKENVNMLIQPSSNDTITLCFKNHTIIVKLNQADIIKHFFSSNITVRFFPSMQEMDNHINFHNSIILLETDSVICLVLKYDTQASQYTAGIYEIPLLYASSPESIISLPVVSKTSTGVLNLLYVEALEYEMGDDNYLYVAVFDMQKSRFLVHHQICITDFVCAGVEDVKYISLGLDRYVAYILMDDIRYLMELVQGKLQSAVLIPVCDIIEQIDVMKWGPKQYYGTWSDKALIMNACLEQIVMDTPYGSDRKRESLYQLNLYQDSRKNAPYNVRYLMKGWRHIIASLTIRNAKTPNNAQDKRQKQSGPGIFELESAVPLLRSLRNLIP